MATYVWDLGFDFKAVQNSDTTSYLQNGFVLHTPGGSSLAVPVNLKEHDKIDFSLFNLTALGSDNDAGDYSIKGGSITFSPAEINQAAISPFSATHVPVAPLAATSTVGPSLVFNGNFPKWPLAETLTVAQAGKFLMTVALIVEGPSGPQRTFVVDPEMIVGGAT